MKWPAMVEVVVAAEAMVVGVVEAVGVEVATQLPTLPLLAEADGRDGEVERGRSKSFHFPAGETARACL